MIGIEFDETQRRVTVSDAAFERGLLTLGCRVRTVRLLPPLDVTDSGLSLQTGAIEPVEA